jgi:hypothetical protein
MTAIFVAEFVEAPALLEAIRRAKTARQRVIDTFSPFPIEGMPELLDSTSTRLRVYMFLGGMTVAAIAYAVEGWSAVYSYPINSGGRALNSWPAFMLFPFAIGIFGAALVGFIALLVQTGLPRLHHPLFDIAGFERVTQDRFMLALEAPADTTGKRELASWLKREGAVNVWELET